MYVCMYVCMYVFDREKERERVHKQGEQQAKGEGEAGSPWSREPNAGLDPGPWDHDPSRREMLND